MTPIRIALGCLVSAVLLHASTAGSFRGVIVASPSAGAADWIFIRGNNQVVRRVNVATAKVVYAEEIPASRRRPGSAGALPPGTDVRVTAEQDGDGEWRATEIEVLNLPPDHEIDGKRVATTTGTP